MNSVEEHWTKMEEKLVMDNIETNISTYLTTLNFWNKWTKILDLETTIFESNMMVKSGLVFFILKFYWPLQSYLLSCQANSAFLGRFFCTKGASRISRPLFTIIFNSNVGFKTWDFSSLILGVLGGVQYHAFILSKAKIGT